MINNLCSVGTQPVCQAAVQLISYSSLCVLVGTHHVCCNVMHVLPQSFCGADACVLLQIVIMAGGTNGMCT